MRNTWGRPPKNDLWNDIQALALWVLIIGIVGYLLFPNFFQSVYTQLTDQQSNEEELGEVSLPSMSMDSNDNYQVELPSVYDVLYNGESEISDGYWAIFVGEGEFEQMPLTSDSYTFLLSLIDSDREAEVNKILLIAAQGKIHKYIVSDEVYGIIRNLKAINSRTNI